MQYKPKQYRKYLKNHEYAIYNYEISNIHYKKFFHDDNPDEYLENDPCDAFLVLQDHHGTWLVTGGRDDIINYLDGLMKISHEVF